MSRSKDQLITSFLPDDRKAKTTFCYRHHEPNHLRRILRMKSAISLALLFTLSTFLTTSAATQKKPLTNDDVVKMVKAGLDQNVITQTIAASPQEFDLSSDALIHLKEEGVPDSVVQAMVSR